MLKKFKKIITLIVIIEICTLLFINKAFAAPTNDVDNNVYNFEEANEEDSENNEENAEEAEVYSTSPEEENNNEPNYKIVNTTEEPNISSYSTTTTIPEANLKLNNILNILLIPIGLLMIFLAIAILIKLKDMQ